MPTRSRRAERRSRIAAALLGLAGSQAWAHEPGADALPETPGWQVGAAAALIAPAADSRWPAATWPGVLDSGSAARDQRHGLRLEHGTLDAATRVNRWLGAHLALGWHDREGRHVEAAKLQVRWPVGPDELQVELGRDTVRMGGVIDGAGHFDRFSQLPLAKRAVLGDQWIDDGVSASWRRADVERGLRRVELGVWRGQTFPGGAHGPAMPALHLHGGWDHLDAHLFAAHLEPQGRGTLMQSATGSPGHSHGSLDCRASLQQRVCLDGRVELLGSSLQWERADGGLLLSLAGLLRRERGALYSLSSTADYRATTQGLWADAAWKFRPSWTLAGRVERMVPRNNLAGASAGLLAQDAGLAQGAPVSRLSLALSRQLREGLELAFETGTEHTDSQRLNHLALRLLWREPRLLGGSW
jgi:hypothetical protein